MNYYLVTYDCTLIWNDHLITHIWIYKYISPLTKNSWWSSFGLDDAHEILLPIFFSVGKCYTNNLLCHFFSGWTWIFSGRIVLTKVWKKEAFTPILHLMCLILTTKSSNNIFNVFSLNVHICTCQHINRHIRLHLWIWFHNSNTIHT